MVSSWSEFASTCKSRLSAIARSCFLGRVAAREKCRDIQLQLREAGADAARSKADALELEAEVQRLRAALAKLEARFAQPQPVTLPLGEPPPGMQYGAGLIEVCVNLAREVGLRRTVRALKVVLAWLGAEVTLPTYQAIRTWLQRIGLDRMQNARREPGGVWLADHTIQIGKEKALAIVRVPGDRPREAGPLRQEELEVLALVPSESSKREDVLGVYQQAAERFGVPRAIESDGAPELQEPIGMLGDALPKTAGKTAKKPLAIRDPKHFLANQLEALLARDSAWQEFTQQLGGTRSAVQQTELAPFTPPAFKTKARFMNLAATLRWAGAVLWHGEHSKSQSRRRITAQRWQDKLGWLRKFAPNLREWQACQAVVDTALKFLNQRGLFRGATKQLQKLVAQFTSHPLCQQLIQALLKFVQGYEEQLNPGERLPMSTEILESCFAKYKQLEQQHSKGGFTSLLLTLPVLLRPTTAAEITTSMQRTKMADIETWKQQHLPVTLTSRRQLMYREAKPKRTTPTSATPASNAN